MNKTFQLSSCFKAVFSVMIFATFWACSGTCPKPTNFNVSHTIDSATGDLLLNYTWDANSAGNYKLDLTTKNGTALPSLVISTTTHTQSIPWNPTGQVMAKLASVCGDSIYSETSNLRITINVNANAMDSVATVDVDVF